MKINSIHIISFGGLKNYSLDFNSGYNCIYGDNEQGKTTVMSFIKMMFYGSERGSSQISKNIRKKYTPWDGSQMSGSVDFELNGKGYRLEREFRSSNSTDRVSLTDLSLGEKQSVEGDIGVKLFGLTACAFERSIFMGQLGFPESDTSAESEINARLSNLVSTGDEAVSLEAVLSKLEKARFALISKGGKTGEYNKNLSLANELEDKLKASTLANRQYTEAKENLIAHNSETKRLAKKADGLKQLILKEQDIVNAQKLKELLSLKAELEEAKKQLLLKNGSPADENFMRNLSFLNSKYMSFLDKEKVKLNELKIVENNLNAMLLSPSLTNGENPESLQKSLKVLEEKTAQAKEKIDGTKSALEQEHSKSAKDFRKKFNPLFLTLGIICFLATVFFFALSIPVIGATFGLSALLLLSLSFALRPADNKKIALSKERINNLNELISNQSSLIEDLTEQINSKKIQLESIRIAAQSNTTVIDSQREQIKALQLEIEELKKERKNAETELKNAIEQFGDYDVSQIETVLQKLKTASETQKDLKLKINALLGVLGNISYEQAERKLEIIQETSHNTSVDFEAVKKEYDTLWAEITSRKEKEAAGIEGLKSLISGVEVPSVLEKKLAEVRSLLKVQKDFCDSADLAAEVLRESFSELRQSYSSSLEKRASEIFSKLTDGKYSDITVSKSLNLNVTESGSLSREAEYLSSGTFDQAYLSLRLALSELMCEDETLPLFLDDSLTQYDDTRAKQTVEFLKDFCKKRQIIMFTCHKSIANLT